MYYPEVYVTMEAYPILKDKMESFDLLMFRGDDIISDTIAEIQLMENRNISHYTNDTNDTNDTTLFTHAGLIIKPEILPDYSLDPNRLYILESTYSYEIKGMNNGPPDYLSKRPYFGVQLRDLEEVCKKYIRNEKTKISWFKLTDYPNIEDFSPIFSKYYLLPFFSDSNKPLILSMFDLTKITPEILLLAKSIINIYFLQSLLKSAFSCVNLITSVYRDLGLLAYNTTINYPMELLEKYRYTVYSSTITGSS